MRPCSSRISGAKGKRNIRRALRLAGWNALLATAGSALIAAAAEAYFRLAPPFTDISPVQLAPGVGPLFEPMAEVRATNGVEYWTVSRANSLGFLDREPVSAERAAAGCHVTVIGDSNVAAKQAPIADKVQVKLEESAARSLPGLDITASAFGYPGTGQINQLAFYDAYARRLSPKLIVLVFVPNDFVENVGGLQALFLGLQPEQLPFVSAERGEDGAIRLRPPAPDYSMTHRVKIQTRNFSVFVRWLRSKIKALSPERLSGVDRRFATDAEALSRRPGYASLLDGWQPKLRNEMSMIYRRKNLPPFFEESLEFTSFALRQFKERAERDGASVVIISSHFMRKRGDFLFERLNRLARPLGIPVIDQYDYIVRQGYAVGDAQWKHDGHWNQAGHRWAAEAVLEHLERNPEICSRQPPPTGKSTVNPSLQGR